MTQLISFPAVDIGDMFDELDPMQRHVLCGIVKDIEVPTDEEWRKQEAMKKGEEKGFKISRLLADISRDSNPISEDSLLDEGWWQFEFILNDDNPSQFTNYHFILEVSEDDTFSNILISKDSLGIKSWEYEKEKETFVDLTFTGASSSYIGRKVRYTSRYDDLIGLDEYLTRGQTYYFRIKQYNISTLEQYPSRVTTDIIYT